MKKYALLAAINSVLLAGCNEPTNQTLNVGGNYAGMAIVPNSNISVAEIYRTSVPKAQISGQSELKHLCDSDFTNTASLANIRKKYASAPGTTLQDYKETQTDNWSASVTGINLGFINIGGSYAPSATTVIDYEKVKLISADDEDVTKVLSQIGTTCKSLMAKYEKQGYGVFVITGAYQAGTLSITVNKNTDVGANGTIKIKQIAPGLSGKITNSNAVAITGKDLYFKVETSENP